MLIRHLVRNLIMERTAVKSKRTFRVSTWGVNYYDCTCATQEKFQSLFVLDNKMYPTLSILLLYENVFPANVTLIAFILYFNVNMQFLSIFSFKYFLPLLM